ncbi:uncharacterized protein LOC110988618 [Acanthaster planci]|uniref:Uncharacterized protein LOC110988618 n=1 Tax=Acanthaster planci TaxID=133434 RepID=A0A8B7ZSH9_ACAPL|nr:uncharacterized protein LOC110988618 [Acanthaster planci]
MKTFEDEKSHLEIRFCYGQEANEVQRIQTSYLEHPTKAESVERDKRKYWKMAADTLRASGGEPKDLQKIRKKWQDIACDDWKYYRERQTMEEDKCQFQPAYNMTLALWIEKETCPEATEILNQVAEAVSHTEDHVDVGEVVVMMQQGCDPESPKVKRRNSSTARDSDVNYDKFGDRKREACFGEEKTVNSERAAASLKGTQHKP